MKEHIELRMEPLRPPMDGKSFRALDVPFAIAIDGFVREGPWFDNTLPSQCFNHHEGVARLETRSTCAQALLAVRQGLFRRFRDAAGPRAVVFANDCDEDVCTAWFVLKNHALTGQVTNPMLNRLVYMVDLLDTTAGAYPFPEDLPSLRVLAWVFEPYRRFRLSGGLGRRSADEFMSIVTDVEHRIGAHVAGHGRELDIDTRYEVTSQERGWVAVREVGAQARIGMFSDGIRAFLSSMQLGNGRWTHVVGRMSVYEHAFRIPEILEACNVAEDSVAERLSGDCWGGGDTIGGSPRIGGSALDPVAVIGIIRGVLSGSGR